MLNRYYFVLNMWPAKNKDPDSIKQQYLLLKAQQETASAAADAPSSHAEQAAPQSVVV